MCSEQHNKILTQYDECDSIFAKFSYVALPDQMGRSGQDPRIWSSGLPRENFDQLH